MPTLVDAELGVGDAAAPSVLAAPSPLVVEGSRGGLGTSAAAPAAAHGCAASPDLVQKAAWRLAEQAAVQRAHGEAAALGTGPAGGLGLRPSGSSRALCTLNGTVSDYAPGDVSQRSASGGRGLCGVQAVATLNATDIRQLARYQPPPPAVQILVLDYWTSSPNPETYGTRQSYVASNNSLWASRNAGISVLP